jgi:hypothetical protein
VHESDEDEHEKPQGMVAAMMQLQVSKQPAALSDEEKAVEEALAMLRACVAARGQRRDINLR